MHEAKGTCFVKEKKVTDRWRYTFHKCFIYFKILMKKRDIRTTLDISDKMVRKMHFLSLCVQECSHVNVDEESGL